MDRHAAANTTAHAVRAATQSGRRASRQTCRGTPISVWAAFERLGARRRGRVPPPQPRSKNGGKKISNAAAKKVSKHGKAMI